MAKIINAIFIIVWLLLIFTFSCENGEESKNTSTVLTDSSLNIANKVVGKKVNELTKESFATTHLTLIRKSAHFIEYFVLGILCFCLLKQYGMTNTKNIIFSLLFCFVYACSDEIHQLFVPGRTSRAFDVLIDSIGSLTGIFFCQLIIKIKSILF